MRCKALGRRPVFTVTVAAVLAVGVTVSIVAFSLLDALVLRPLPVDRPEQLVYMRDPSFSFPQLREVRAHRDIFPSSFAWNLTQLDVQWSDARQPTLVMLASGEIHQALGVRAALGRLLIPADEGRDESSAQPVAVLSYRAWQNRFAADPAVLGRTIRIDDASGHDCRSDSAGVLRRLSRPSARNHRAGHTRSAAARARRSGSRATRWLLVALHGPAARGHANQAGGRGLSGGLATDARDDDAHRLASRSPREIPWRATGLESAAAGFSSVRNQFQRPMMVLCGFAALLLIITCATVANMLVAQTLGRSREVAMRMALGCGRVRLCRQLLIEGIVLAILASLAAFAVGPALSRALVTLVATSQAPVTIDWTVDARLLALTLSLVALTACAFSAAPMRSPRASTRLLC